VEGAAEVRYGVPGLACVDELDLDTLTDHVEHGGHGLIEGHQPILAARKSERDTQQAMSRENVEIVQSYFDAYVAGDPSSAERFMDPRFEFVPSHTSHVTAPVLGWKQFNRVLADMANQFESYEVAPEKIIDTGDDRVVVAHRRIAKSHGVQVEDRLAHVITVRGGRISRIASFRSLEEALEAAGLRE
jgi:ketosteroid isomerase-like protein